MYDQRGGLKDTLAPSHFEKWGTIALVAPRLLRPRFMNKNSKKIFKQAFVVKSQCCGPLVNREGKEETSICPMHTHIVQVARANDISQSCNDATSIDRNNVLIMHHNLQGMVKM